jgi:redox-sensitive bicupin YhaK (pirin superfamily)
MSAGTGVFHSEFNASDSETLHLLQIWIEPDTLGIEPGYEQKHFAEAERSGRLRLIVSPDGREGSLSIHQDAFVYASVVDPDEALEHAIEPGRHAWVHVARGNVVINGIEMGGGDGAGISGESEIKITGVNRGELLLFDLA